MPFLPGENRLVGACTTRGVAHFSSSLATVTDKSGLEAIYPFVDVMFAQDDAPEFPVFSGYHLDEYLKLLKSDRPIDYATYLAWIHDAFDSEIQGLFNRLSTYERKHCFSSLAIGLPFHSQLYDTIHKISLNKASPSQWKATIANLTNKGVRKEEIDWFGLIEWLKHQHREIPKEEILSRIDIKPITIDIGQECECSRIRLPDFSGEDGLRDINNDFRIVRRVAGGDAKWNWEVRFASNNGRMNSLNGVFGFNTVEEAKQAIQDVLCDRMEPLKPAKAHKEYTIPGGENYRELLLTLPDYYRSYVGPHYTSRNVLAHVRITDRRDMLGQKILFIEEMQSDWHSEGRKYGNVNHSSDHRAVQPAPFSKSYYELALKIMLYYAAKESYDGVCWTTGRLQRLRYESESTGFDTLYDCIIPDHANRIVRQWGMSSGKVDLPICHFGRMSVEGKDEEWYVLDERDNSVGGPFGSDHLASQAMYELSTNNSMIEVPVVWLSGHRDKIISSPIPLFGLPAVKGQYTEPMRDHKKHEHVLDVQLAGFQFHDGSKMWNDMHEGDDLSLKREPNNRYDEKAISIFWRKNKLGYVPKFQNKNLAQMMDMGCGLSARINALRKSGNPMERVCIGISKEV